MLTYQPVVLSGEREGTLSTHSLHSASPFPISFVCLGLQVNSLVEFHSKNFNESQLLDLTHFKDYSSSSSRLQYERHHHCQDSHQIIRGSVREKRIESLVFTEFCLCDKPKLSKNNSFKLLEYFIYNNVGSQLLSFVLGTIPRNPKILA